MWKVKAVIEINEIPKDKLNAVEAALKPELGMELRGVRTSLTMSSERLKLIIEAPDYSAFRAAVNNILRLLNTALEVLSSVDALKEEHQ